jgi:hypothetical protein
MFRLLPKLSLPHILRPRPERIDESFLEQELDRGLESRIRTLGAKAGLSPDVTDRLAAAHVAADASARVEVSRPDQVTGLRRLILMGPAYHRQTTSYTMPFGDEPSRMIDDTRSPLTLIGVTGDGLLFRRGLYTDDGAPSPREGLRLARHAPHRLLPGIGAADPGLNRYNGGVSGQVRDATDHVLRLTSAVLSKEERDALPYRFIMGIEHVTRGRIARRLALARYALNDALDPALLRLMRGCALQSLSEAEWICGATRPDPVRTGPGRWLGVGIPELNDRDLSRARVQAVRAYPAMAKVIFQDPILKRAVDDRAPLAPVIAAHLGVEEAEVRHLNGLTWQMAAVAPTNPAQGLARLAKVPRELVPTRRAEHRQLRLIVGFSDLFREPFGQTMRRFAKGGSPYRFGEEIKRVSPSDVGDAAEYLVDKLLLPARLHAIRRLCEVDGLKRPAMGGAQTRNALVQELIRPMSMRDLFGMSDRWHRNLTRHEDRLVTLRSGVSWDPFLGDADLGCGVRARELASAQALQIQGKREGHCVGGYTDKLLRAGPNRIPLIFSLERDGEVLGTAEILLRLERPKHGEGLSEPVWGAELVQNRSRHNDQVCEGAARAALTLCRSLEAAGPEGSSPYLEGLSKVRRKRSRHGGLSSHLRSAGYDIWEPGRLEAAWAELSGYLPRGVRKAGLEALIQSEMERVSGVERENPSRMAELVRVTEAIRQPLTPDRSAGLIAMFEAEDRAPPFWVEDARAVAALHAPEPEMPERPARRPVEEEECLPF